VEEVEAVFGRGEALAPAGKRQVERLYMEVDGVLCALAETAAKAYGIV